MVATVVLRQGSGPSCPGLYVVHGLDGDVMGGGSSYATLAGHLTSWRVVAMVYDEEAYACGSVPALAACYNRRVLEDVSKNGEASAENPIVVAGYSFGCVLAHQMAYQLSQDGRDVLLVMFDLEVTWPPPKSDARVGGYDFLGGEVEAILLLCRAFGKHAFAHQAVLLMTEAKSKGESIDVDYLRQQAFSAINHRGMSYELFSTLAKRGGVNIEKIHTISDPWQPPEKYHGPALLVLAPDSAEFASAKEVNEQYCSQMEVVYGKGSHYNILQGEQALVSGDLLHKFCQRFSPAVSRLPNEGPQRSSTKAAKKAVSDDKLLILRRGSPGIPQIYLVHGLDGDVMSGGATFKTIAAHLEPCRVGALVYDSEALACNSVPALCSLYNSRVLADSESFKNGAAKNLIVVAGYSFGCVLAHQMGYQLQQAGVEVAVVMFDLEVTWPPPQTNSRVGGYDFLGGEAEAILLITRGFGKFEFAVKEAMELAELRRRNESFDVDALRERAFKALNQRGLSIELFTMLVKRGGVNIQQLHTIADPWQPPEKYDGPALLVLAPDSQEFASAKEINAQFCTAMEVASGAGSHYNMMQGAQAGVQAQLVKEFLHRLPGVDLPIALSPQPATKAAKKETVGEDKLLILRRGAPGLPRVYMVHGLDGDVMSGGGTFKTIAAHLEPCRVGALVYDSEALACNSVPALCSLYNSRVLADSESFKNGAAKSLIVVAGYSFGCVLAHQMGYQLQQAGVEVAVVMFDLEVTWPPPQTNSRVGGYDFLGGEAEAILLISRGFGKFEFAVKEAMELAELRRRNESFDVDALRERAFKALNQRGLSIELFTMLVKRGGVNIQQLHTIADPWQPPEKYDGPALLVLAPDSQEFASAKEINAQFCTIMEVASGAGSHYNMMQGAQAAVQAHLVKEFLQRLSGMDLSSPAAPAAPAVLSQTKPATEAAKKETVGEDKLLILRRGAPGLPKVYMVHGLDGDVMSGGATFKTIAAHLEPCRVGALIYDSEALACDSVPALCSLYNSRVLADSESFSNGSASSPVIVAGYSFGCVLAHQMGYQLRQAGVNVAVVLFDLEVTWPPPQTNSRVGGYDFLGGEAEAILLIARGFGKFEFAVKEAMELAELQRRNESFDVDALRERAFQALNQRGMSFELFTLLVKRGGVNIQQLHSIADPWQPPEQYEGPALLVLAPDSQEFASAKEINAQFCTEMEVALGAGSHYNMMQGAQAMVQAQLVKDFLQRLFGVDFSNANVPGSLSIVVPESSKSATDDTAPVDFVQGIRALRDGPEGSCAYFLHGLDGDALGPGMSLGSLPSMMSGRVCAVEYDDEAFACESIEALSRLYKSRILQDRAKKQAEDVLLAGRSMGALLACMIALELQKEQIRCSLVTLDSEVIWPSKLDNSFCYDWLGGEVEATLWLSRLAGAKDFVEEQVQSAVTRGHLFDEGASRLQTAAFGQIASNLTAFGVNSLKEFRSICTLASSNCARLRQLLRPTSGSMRAPSGIFDGKVLIVAGEERGQKLRQVASSHCRNISMCTVSTEEVYVGEAATTIANEISWFLRSRSQDRRRKPGPEATPDGKSAREEEALVSLEEISTATYLVPGPDGGILGEMFNLAEALNCDCHLDFDEEACRYSTLPDVAALFLRRIFQDQGWTSEEDLVHARQCKMVLVGHRSGAVLAYEMAMQLQNMEIDVRLVIIQGEVSMAGSQKWLGNTCEATLALAHRLGAKDFALQEAASMAAARKEKLEVSKGRLQTRCGLAFDGISGGSLNGHPKNGVLLDDDSNKLLMKAFWKVSDQLNGMSVEGFKGLIQDIASRMDWYMNLGSGGDFAFDGPALLILGDGEAPEDADAMIESNALYCTNLEVADVSGDEHTCLNDDNIRMLADHIIGWQEKQVPYLMNGSERVLQIL